MVNGKPGDHPVTDIVVHGLPTFSSQADGLIREIVQLGGRDELETRIDLWRSTRRPTDNESSELAEMESQLTHLRDELLADRRERGWDV